MMLPALVCLLLFASGTDAAIPRTDPGLRPGIRVDVSARKKIAQPWTLSGGTEVRMYNLHLTEERFDLYGGATYRVAPSCKLQGEYRLMFLREDRSDVYLRHRLSLACSQQWKDGHWHWTVTETLRATLMEPDRNPWNKPACRLETKARMKAEYKLSRDWRLPLGVELRQVLNDPVVSGYQFDADALQFVTPEGLPEGEPGWFFDGFGRCYVNRVRTMAGVEHACTSHCSISALLYGDYCSDFHLKANRSGTRIKSIVWQDTVQVTLRLSCRYSF